MTLDEAIKHAEEVAKDCETAFECGIMNYLSDEENVDNISECAMEHRQLAELLKELKQLRKQTRWIPVSERLPKDGVYLVTVERTLGKPRIETKSFAKDLNRVDDFDFSEHKCGWYDYDSEYGYWEDTNVIAWMSLPEPYKAESEG